MEMCFLLSLPEELLSSTIARLDVKSILRSSETCRLLRSIVQGPNIQLKIALARSGLKPNPNFNLPSAEALKLLRSWNDRWEALAPLVMHSISFSEYPSFRADCVDGVFVRGISSTPATHVHRKLEINTLPTANTARTMKIYEDIGCDVQDFAIDPGQDLLVLLEAFAEQKCEINLHFHTMSANTPHPLASTGMGTGADIWHSTHFLESQYSPDLQICGNLFALCTDNNLRIWNWHSGDLLTWIKLPTSPYTQAVIPQFSFISYQYFMVVDPVETRINLYEIPDTACDPMNYTSPIPKVALGLPPGLGLTNQRSIRLNTDPIPHYSDQVKPYPGSSVDTWPFMPSEDSRIRVITISIPVPQKFHLTIKNSWLVECIAGSSHGKVTCNISWSDWGRTHGHWDIADTVYPWIRWTHGGRVIHPPTIGNMTDMIRNWCITVTDFSRGPGGSSQGSKFRPDTIARPPVEVYRLLDMPLPPTDSESDPDVEQHPASRPWYFVTHSSDQLFPSLANYQVYMLDERRIIGN